MACIKRITLLALFLSSSLFSWPYLVPWTGVDKELYMVPFATYEHLGPLPQEASHDVGYQGLLLDIALDWDLEISLIAKVAESDRRPFLYDSITWIFSKVFMDDVIGDPFSMMFSLTGKNVGGKALLDPCFLHFGEWEWRGTLLVGKEFTKCFDWWYRLSGSLTAGIANRGSPWIESGFLYEQKIDLCRRFDLGLQFLHNFGGKNIRHTPYHIGWGPFNFTQLFALISYRETICDHELIIALERTIWSKGTFGNDFRVTFGYTL